MPLKRYVIQETTENRVTFYFRSPREGNYYITVFAQQVNARGDGKLVPLCDIGRVVKVERFVFLILKYLVHTLKKKDKNAIIKRQCNICNRKPKGGV